MFCINLLRNYCLLREPSSCQILGHVSYIPPLPATLQYEPKILHIALAIRTNFQYTKYQHIQTQINACNLFTAYFLVHTVFISLIGLSACLFPVASVFVTFCTLGSDLIRRVSALLPPCENTEYQGSSQRIALEDRFMS